ncbi:hypothetical protein [Paenibacillus polymyxa]|uniref:hypothetical protein n=1 Tax=Paenibacillus polymyxa TaxID=1406 RepID=UPI0032AFEA2D
MNEILTIAGLISIVLPVLYSVKKIYDFIDLQKVTRKDLYENYSIKQFRSLLSVHPSMRSEKS